MLDPFPLTEFPLVSFSLSLFFHLCSFYLFVPFTSLQLCHTLTLFPLTLSLADCPLVSNATCPKHSHPRLLHTCFTSLSFSFSFTLPPVPHDITIPDLELQRPLYVFKSSGSLPTSTESSSCLLFFSLCQSNTIVGMCVTGVTEESIYSGH